MKFRRVNLFMANDKIHTSAWNHALRGARANPDLMVKIISERDGRSGNLHARTDTWSPVPSSSFGSWINRIDGLVRSSRASLLKRISAT